MSAQRSEFSAYPRRMGRRPEPCRDYEALRAAHAVDPRPTVIAHQLGASVGQVRRWLAELGLATTIVRKHRPHGITPAYVKVVRVAGGKRLVARLYEIWLAMRKRCYGSYREDFHHYGGRGITVCAEWREDYDAFRKWAIGAGYRKELTIDRIDSNGNYEPANCRWATREQQTYNNSGTTHLTYNGETLPSPIWAKRLGMHPNVFRHRITDGWTVEEAITTPKGALRPGKLRGRAAWKAKQEFVA